MSLDISSILRAIMNLIIVILPSFITALLFHYFVEKLKRPVIEIYEDEDKYSPQFDVHHLHVRIANKSVD